MREKPFLRCWAEIDLDKLRSNIRNIKACVGKGVKILLPVKADAYGHGALMVAKIASEEHIAMLGVATVEEAEELIAKSIKLPILVLSPCLPQYFSRAIQAKIKLTISSLDAAIKLNEVAQSLNQKAHIHVDIDTGMGRGGFLYTDTFAIMQQLKALPFIHIEGLSTHFPMAGKKDKSFTTNQLQLFNAELKRLEAANLLPEIIHASNSAGVLDFDYGYFNMVRPGLIAYGLYPTYVVSHRIQIEPVMSLRARVVHINELPAGWGISYGQTYKLTVPSKVGIISVGYGDGYVRALSNRASVIIKGVHCPVIGKVTMDLTQVLIPDELDCQVGDIATLIGTDGEAYITAERLADIIDTINYEVVTVIGKRVPRIYMQHGEAIAYRYMHEDLLEY